MNVTQQLLSWADRLRDISAMGLRFARNIHDEMHFRQVQEVAMEMAALGTGMEPAEIEPLRATLFARPTPLVTGDGAVIDARGRLLLVRRADNGCWAMPGGALEVGETPAAGVAREVLEETGVHCQPVSLAGVFDSRLCGTVTAHHLYQFLFLCRPLDREAAEASHAVEVSAVGWFAEDELPADLDPGHRSRIPHVFRAWRGDHSAFFDPA